MSRHSALLLCQALQDGGSSSNSPHNRHARHAAVTCGPVLPDNGKSINTRCGWCMQRRRATIQGFFETRASGRLDMHYACQRAHLQAHQAPVHAWSASLHWSMPPIAALSARQEQGRQCLCCCCCCPSSLLNRKRTRHCCPGCASLAATACSDKCMRRREEGRVTEAVGCSPTRCTDTVDDCYRRTQC